MANELTTLPADANPSDYNRIERFEITISLAGCVAEPSPLKARTLAAAKTEAAAIRAGVRFLPTFQGAKLSRSVVFVYEPYCPVKHDNAEF